MKMLCKLHRPNGTQIVLDGVTYDFQPDEHGRHVCEVEREDHQDIFLGIPEGYRPVTDSPSQKVEGKVPTQAPTLEPADDGDDEGDGEDEDTERKDAPSDDGEVDLDELTDEELDKEYEHAIGSKPNAKAKRETKIARILKAYEE